MRKEKRTKKPAQVVVKPQKRVVKMKQFYCKGDKTIVAGPNLKDFVFCPNCRKKMDRQA